MTVENEYILYMLLLENDKLFFYASTPKNDLRIMEECFVAYEFVRNNPPVRILNKTHFQYAIEVDYYVKRNMLEVGIDKVRGGTYSMEVLPEFLLKTLEIELSANYKKEQDVFNTIYSKYTQEFLNNANNREKEIENITKEINKYDFILDTKRLLDNDNKITRELLENIFWITNRCVLLEEEFNRNGKLEKSILSEADSNRYKNLLETFRILYNIFREHMDRPINYEHMIFLEHPQCILDTLFYTTEHITENKKWFSEIKTLLSKYEYMAYSIINKCEEYEFDLSTYPSNFKQLSEYSLYLCSINRDLLVIA